MCAKSTAPVATMTKSLALLALGALLILPATEAQVLPAHTLSVSIDGLPATASTNGTLLALPFTVQASITGNSPCVATSATSYTFNVAAEVLNSTGNATKVQVAPATFTVSGPNTAPGSVSRTSAATLLLDPGTYADEWLNATVLVTVSSPGGNPGCTGSAATAAAEAMHQFTASFFPPQGYGSNGPVGQEMPGLPAPMLLLGLAAAVAMLRRK